MPFIVKLNINDIYRMVSECVFEANRLGVLSENATERKRQEMAHNTTLSVVRNFFNNESWLDTVFEHQDNPNRMTYLDYMVFHFEEEFFHAPRPSKPIIRLEPMVAQLAFEFGFQQQNPQQDKLNELAGVVTYIEKMAKLGKLEIPKVAQMQPKEMFNTFIEAVKEEADRMRSETENSKYNGINTNYEILKDVDFKTANKIGNSSCPSGKLCYTQSEMTWESYTKDGFNTVYVLLKNGYKKIPAKHNGVNEYDFLPEDGYDEYGLSMIFMFVDSLGKLVYCNTRWNHGANYGPGKSVDHALNESEISKIIGANFYELFKGNDKFNQYVEDALKRIANGENPRYIFDAAYLSEGITLIRLHDKYNFINEKHKLMSKQWFDNATEFYDGTAIVCLNGKYNFLTKEGNLLTSQWFDGCSNFREGFARIRLNNKVNYIDKNGNFLSNTWFDDGYSFNKDVVGVCINGKWNFIDKSCNLLSNQWFDEILLFDNDFSFSVVKLNGKKNFLTKEGKILSKQWFDKSEWNFYNGFALIYNDRQCNIMNKHGEIISKQWFDYCRDYDEENDVFYVKKDGKNNVLTQDGRLLSKQWFDYCYNFSDGFCGVKEGNKCNYMDKNGNLLLNEWVDHGYDFQNGFGHVINNEKHNFVSADGNLLSNTWFDDASVFTNGFAAVCLNDKWNYINANGKMLSDMWFDNCFDFDKGGFGVIVINNKCNYITKEGKILSKQWFDYCLGFYGNDFGIVMLNDKWNYITKEGKILSKQWFDEECQPFYDEYTEVIINGNPYLLSIDGEIVEAL